MRHQPFFCLFACFCDFLKDAIFFQLKRFRDQMNNGGRQRNALPTRDATKMRMHHIGNRKMNTWLCGRHKSNEKECNTCVTPIQARQKYTTVRFCLAL